MDRAALTQLIGSSRFARTRGEGYDEQQVDDFLDELAAALSSEEAAEDITARIAGATFTPTRLRAGYALEDVDALLDEVTTGLGGTPSPAATSPTSATDGTGARAGSVSVSGTVASQPSALIAPPKGLLARLFGR